MKGDFSCSQIAVGIMGAVHGKAFMHRHFQGILCVDIPAHLPGSDLPFVTIWLSY